MWCHGVRPAGSDPGESRPSQCPRGHMRTVGDKVYKEGILAVLRRR